jgi:hypothetical protein
MSTEPNPSLALNLEWRILRALCTDSPAPDSPNTHDASALPAILDNLRAHPWQDPEHRVVFEALTLLPGRQSSDLREQLPAQATRMGFPDVSWDRYFAPSNDHAAIEALVAELLNCAERNRP